MTDGKWTAVLSPDASAAALARIASAARPHHVPHCVRPHLAGGGAGLALAFHWLDRGLPGQGWDAFAEGYLAAAFRGYERLGASPGLFGGAAGLAFAAWSVSRDGAAPGYPALHDRIVGESFARARELGDGPVPARAVDVVSGLTGAGAYLLCRDDEPGSAAAFRTVLTVLTRTGARGRGEPPDPGLAHGLSGPLALLSLALGKGVAVPGQREAVGRLAEMLNACRTDDARGPDWPGTTTGSAGRTVRASWCRGSPGTARALWLAGTALDDEPLRDLAVRALKAVHLRPPGERRIDGDPGLCHGLAGLLQITSRFAHDTGDPGLTSAADRLAAVPFPANGDPGFLDGAAGAVLAVLGAVTDVEPRWDRALLLA
ncbi:lanthionine synthetase C family protein [Streptomyces roseoverticillatus]|uniref:lanthionine synthetase C family protein n=1 Tax=Streptomyces roseoverticillatus TaxID=66429 RepID=UPI001F26573A|nr:lanthionine synthetase C family protein [Streptomyces roseoverticillatus]MCF3102040.1 lanthionine synthetase C family protein [Streptomyces roseoverticillatus]